MLAHRISADHPAPLEHERVKPGPGEVSRGHQPVMPAADYDRIPLLRHPAIVAARCGASSVCIMASIFVTGSSDGIGLQTARQLVNGGHRIVLHDRDEARAAAGSAAVPGA